MVHLAPPLGQAWLNRPHVPRVKLHQRADWAKKWIEPFQNQHIEEERLEALRVQKAGKDVCTVRKRTRDADENDDQLVRVRLRRGMDQELNELLQSGGDCIVQCSQEVMTEWARKNKAVWL